MLSISLSGVWRRRSFAREGGNMPTRQTRLTAADINGMWAILPTPATDNASDWRADNTVDLAETARVVEALIDAGVDGLLSLGTFGECATLTWEEKRAFIATVVG